MVEDEFELLSNTLSFVVALVSLSFVVALVSLSFVVALVSLSFVVALVSLSFVVALMSHVLACMKWHGHERSVLMSPREQNQKDRG